MQSGCWLKLNACRSAADVDGVATADVAGPKLYAAYVWRRCDNRLPAPRTQ